jgi:ATP-binding cassette subfamily B protein
MPWWHDHERPEDVGHERQLSFGTMVRRLLPLLRPHRRALLTGLALVLVSVAAQLAGPLVLWRLIDADVATGDRGGIVRSALLYALLFVVSASATYLQVSVLARMGLRIVADLKQRLFEHLLGLSLAYFDTHTPGALLARVESDAERLQALFSEVAVAILRTLLFVGGMLAVMFTVRWQAATAVVLVATPLVLVTVLFFRRMRALYRKVRRLYARISGFVAEYVQGVPILQVFGYERRARERLADRNQEKLVADRRASMFEYGFWGFLSAMEVAAVMGILFVGASGAFGAVMTGGMFVLFLEYARQAFWPLALFAEQLGFIQRAFASADRVFGVLDTPSRAPDRQGARDVVPADWREIAFEHVSFDYDGGTRALDDVSFTLRRGERLALVGLSGGGKTTLVSLLLRYYEPTSGRITLDGRDIRELTLRAWRARLGLVLQDIHLFPGTVAENVRALGDDVGRDAVERAVATVGARDLVARLPARYDEPLAEGGANLSMGERQLLSFARAIVRDPDVLVLDEATSAVDPGTERRLQESVERALAGRTSLIIAHRLATVVNADRILVVHRGRIAEEGRHAALHAQGGIYRDLFDLQFAAGEGA